MASDDPVTILHISDIHAGSGELIDEDGKTSIPGAERAKQLSRLSSYIENFAKTPDFVIVSGDITIKGQPDGLEIFRSWLYQHMEAGNLPPPARVILVPGNHDVTRRMRISQSDATRFQNFWNAFGLSFPHAHIPGLDPPLDLSGFDLNPISENSSVASGWVRKPGALRSKKATLLFSTQIAGYLFLLSILLTRAAYLFLPIQKSRNHRGDNPTQQRKPRGRSASGCA